jgi:NADH-quinone oxidoreductase subunit D
MTYEQAIHPDAVGPTARASGVRADVRVDAPYAGYPDFPVDLITETAGDLAARFVVRINELFVSYRLIHTILNKLPPGERSVRMPRRIPEGETVSRVEAPRGELFYFIRSNGTDKPDRVKVRTPSLCNWA